MINTPVLLKTTIEKLNKNKNTKLQGKIWKYEMKRQMKHTFLFPVYGQFHQHFRQQPLKLISAPEQARRVLTLFLECIFS